MEITIDEWIVEYLKERDNCKLAFEFLEKAFKKCDTFVVLGGSPLMKKIWNISKDSGCWEEERRLIAKYFFASFIFNISKFRVLYPATINQLPDDLRQQTPNDDIYLVETAMNTKDRLILTTDSRLKEKLSGWQELNIQLVDEFLQKYDC